MDNNHKYIILLVDDEPQNIKYLFEVLNLSIYSVFVTFNAQVINQ